MSRPCENNPTGAQKNTKQTPEVIAALKYALGVGCTVLEACTYAGISETTYYEWKSQDCEYAKELDRLRQEPILKAKQTVFDNLGEVKTAQWYLERKCKDEFSLKVENSITGEIKSSVQDMSIEQLQEEAKRLGVDISKI
jgi:hypothetical protein